jgi:lipopolysaccharide export system permease protein
MKIPATFSRYTGRKFLLNLGALLGVLLGIVYLFDTVELIRRASKHDDLPLSLVLQMGLFKLPEVGQAVFPFAVLFGAMFTFWQLNRSHELIVARSAGLSVWQFLAPVAGAAFAVGLITIGAINPLGSLFLGKFEELERTHLTRQQKLVTFFQEGLWLRQETEDGYVIMHAEKISMPDWDLEQTMALFFDNNDSFLQRIDSEKASLEDGRWAFSNAYLSGPRRGTEKGDLYTLPTELTRQDIEESFSSPETMSFWQLPGFIAVLESTGFDATRLRIHYQALLAQPLLFAAMVLLAASVSLRPPRLRAGSLTIAAGIFLGFVVFFLSSYLQALGASGQIPVLLAAWSAPLMAFLTGMGIMLNLEDG